MKKHPVHTQRIRIIGGTHRRRIVAFDEAEGLRPTPDRVREQVFNWLGQYLSGLKVLDLFAGSAVMAFEASSRGAAHIDAVEMNRQTMRTIQAQMRQLQFVNIQMHQQDALSFLQDAAGTYDVIFLDPPYAWQGWHCLWPLLKPHCQSNTRVYIEAAQPPDLPTWLQWLRQDRAGQSHYGLASVQELDL